MRIILLILIASIGAPAQTLKNLRPTLGRLVDKSVEGETQFLNEQKSCAELWKKRIAGNSLTDAEREKLEATCSSEGEPENYYDIMGGACSWYCGGGQDTQTASSELPSHKDIHYTASNAHDLSYKTAWIEGVAGYGIGQTLTYHFPPENISP